MGCSLLRNHTVPSRSVRSGPLALRHEFRKDDTLSVRTTVNALLMSCAYGCAEPSAAPPQPPDVSPPGRRMAVAPALNFSDRPELDPIRVAELFASELAECEGVRVVPVSRVVAVLARRGELSVGSALDAVGVGRRIGAEAIVVPEVTRYEPGRPMVIGLAARLHSCAAGPEAADSDGPAEPGRPRERSEGSENGAAVLETSRVYDESACLSWDGTRKYDESRTANNSAPAEGRYRGSRDSFLRLCCRDTVGRLREGMERGTMAYAADGKSSRERP